MSKYLPLWEYVAKSDTFPLKMSFEDIARVLGFCIDHSFLNCKKQAETLGITVKKISLKEKFVIFDRISR